MTQADRLREARARLFETPSDAARAHGWKVSTYLAHENGQNRLREEVAKRYAKAFKVSWIWLLTGEESEVEDRQTIPVMGYVGAGGDVDPDYEQVPMNGIEQIELDTPLGVLDDPVGFIVRGESMMPRYNDGDIVLVEREQSWSIESMIGHEAVVRVSGGRRYLKKIRQGSKANVYDLVGLNGPTVEDALIEWASPVRVVLPKFGLRHVPVKRSAGTRKKPGRVHKKGG